MKITAVKHYTVTPGWRKNLSTSRSKRTPGIHGWGEAYRSTTAILRSPRTWMRSDYLAGHSPYRHQAFHADRVRRLRPAPRPVELFCAVSASSRRCGTSSQSCKQPVYNLLGGRCRDRSASMRTAGYQMRTGGYARAAEKVIARLHGVWKLDPLPAPWRTWIPKEHEERAVKVGGGARPRSGRTSISSSTSTGGSRPCTPSARPAARRGRLYWMEESAAAEYPDELARSAATPGFRW